MDDKSAITILLQLLEKYPLTSEEKQAIEHVLGLLSWTSLRTGALKNLKEKRLEKKRKERL